MAREDLLQQRRPGPGHADDEDRRCGREPLVLAAQPLGGEVGHDRARPPRVGRDQSRRIEAGRGDALALELVASAERAERRRRILAAVFQHLADRELEAGARGLVRLRISAACCRSSRSRVADRGGAKQGDAGERPGPRRRRAGEAAVMA